MKLRFINDELNIIQHIPTGLFHLIIEKLAERGWEVSLDYRGPNGWSKSGKCSVRKGTSILEFIWDENELGSIIGLKRIVSGLAKEFGLIQHDKPQ